MAIIPVTTILLALVGMAIVGRAASQNYGDALSKCILFFEGQRSGTLPLNQRMKWRQSSAVHDGNDVGMDLQGGYYDAGDNVKFNFPMAFSTTLLSWSVIEFGQFMGSELQNAQDSIRWATDYLLNSTKNPGRVVAAVGDPNADHNCWERPEDMDTPRTSYVVDETHPGSEVAAETAAALAASSLALQSADKKYSETLLNRAKRVFEFADKFRGNYADSVGSGVCPFYCDYSGYMDDLVWAAAWLFKVTKDQKYWNYLQNNKLQGGGSSFEFSWDAKFAGLNVLVSQIVPKSNSSNSYVSEAENFLCSLLPDSPSKSVTHTPGGLLFKRGGSNMQYATSFSFLALVYAQHLKNNGGRVACGNTNASPSKLEQIAKGQVDYILGKNPLGMSYMVGFSQKFPQRIHHRASSLPSVATQPQRIQCKDGFNFFHNQDPNHNLLTGAIVGGPDQNDQYPDNREDASTSEPTTYINAPFVGVLAYFKENPQLLA